MIFVKLDRLYLLIKGSLVNITLIHLYSQLLVANCAVKTISALAIQQPMVVSLHLRDGD
jgi:hypothetical protein